MRGMRFAIGAVLVGVFGLCGGTGCCRWCDEHCPNCHAPAPACYQPVAPAAYQPAPVVQTWQQPAPAPQPTCTCTCTR